MELWIDVYDGCIKGWMGWVGWLVGWWMDERWMERMMDKMRNGWMQY